MKNEDRYIDVPHDAHCLGRVSIGYQETGHCGCPRNDWLNEWVPRRLARGEMAAKLAQWSREQAILGANHTIPQGAPAWVSDAVRAGGRVVAETYNRITHTALSYRAECEKEEPPESPVERMKAELRTAMMTIEDGELEAGLDMIRDSIGPSPE